MVEVLTGNIGKGTIAVVVDVADSGIVIMYFAVQYAPKASNPVINKLKTTVIYENLCKYIDGSLR